MYWTRLQGEAGAVGNAVTVKIDGPSEATATLVVFCPPVLKDSHSLAKKILDVRVSIFYITIHAAF